MKFLVLVLAVFGAASAQLQRQNVYRPFEYQNQNRLGQYNQYNQYNPFQQNQYRYNQYSTPAPFRPFVSSTAAPVTIAPIVSPAPVPVPIAIAKATNYDSRNANTVAFENTINPDGSYNYFYQTDNGIAAQEQGAPRNFGGNPPVAPDVAQGSFSWTSPEGVPVAISYIADENGYQPTGAAIPTPPPVPALIARALEYIARTAPVQKK